MSSPTMPTTISPPQTSRFHLKKGHRQVHWLIVEILLELKATHFLGADVPVAVMHPKLSVQVQASWGEMEIVPVKTLLRSGGEGGVGWIRISWKLERRLGLMSNQILLNDNIAFRSNKTSLGSAGKAGGG